MELIKKNKAVIIIAGVLLILILMRSTGMNHFKTDVKKWAEPSVNQSNIITDTELGKLSGALLIISLDKTTMPVSFTGEIKNISPDSVLSKKNIKEIIKHDGPVVICSSDPGLSARIWMLLSQMGKSNLYILTDNADNEVLKFKFQPDTGKIN